MLEIKKFKIQDHKIKALIYGKSGSGKTTLGATAPKPLFICAENGLASISDLEPEYVEVKTIQELKDVYNELKKGLDYDSIVIDSISEIGKVIKEELTRHNELDMNMRKRGQYAEEMMQIIRDIIRLPYNVVCIIHDKPIVDDEGNILMYDIAVQGSAKQEIPRYFDIIAYTYIKDGKHFATCKPNEKLITKDRLRCLPDPLPMDITERLDIIKKKVKIGKQKVVKTIETNLDDVKNKLKEMYDNGTDLKVLVEKIEKSDKYTDEEKNDILEYLKTLG